QVLVEAGGDLVAIREQVESLPPVRLDLPAVLSAARGAAGLRAESTVTGEFLVVGLIRAAESLAAPLERAGVRIPRLVETVEPPPLPLSEPIDFRDTTDYGSAARVVDANANRAREALRVLDDYCRFVLDDTVLTGEAKELRHEFADLIGQIPANVLRESRDTRGD